MKKFRGKPLFLIFLLLFVLCRSAAGDGSPLTLEKTLDLAEKNNPVLSAGKERIAQGKARLDQATAAGVPDLAVSLLYQETGDAPLHPVFIGGGQVGFARAGFQTTWKAALSLTHVLYSGGALRLNEKARKAALEGIIAQEERTRQGVFWSVQSSWYDLLRARSRLEVAEEVLALAKEHLRQVQILLKNGAVAGSEVLRVEVSVSEAELNRIKGENSVAVAWQALERAVGLPLRNAFSLPPGEEEGVYPPFPEDPLSFALRFRPEMKALERAMNSALFSSRAASALGGPQIILSGEVYAADEVFFPSKAEDWRITLAASWTLWDGGETEAKAREARAAADELYYRIEDLKRQIALEISVAKLNYESSLQRINVARALEKSAGEEYRMALRRYAAQVGTNIDVLDSRVALTNAKNSLVESIYDTRKAQVEMDFALGRTENGKGSEGVK